MKVIGAALVGLGVTLAAAEPEAWAAAPAAFPGASGWAAGTPGGRGGQLLRVTTLAAQGPGSLAEALRTRGPRVIVFEVGGVIDLAGRSLKINEPFATIAGQTAPSPGITLIGAGLGIGTHDVIVQHLHVRPGDRGRVPGSGGETDGISTTRGAWNVIVDHCSISWATDESLSASGPRFDGGSTAADWREQTSHRITFSNNIIAEGLSHSIHAKGEHSKGSLIHDNVRDVLIVGNLYAHNRERNPLFKGGSSGAVVNNVIYDAGRRTIHYNLWSEEWGDHPWQTGELAIVGNVLRAGPSTARNSMSLFMFGGQGNLRLALQDNLAFDAAGKPLPQQGRYTESTAELQQLAVPPIPDLSILPASRTLDAVLGNAGARPWDRDAVDARIVAEVRNSAGRIIDSQAEVGGYPQLAPTHRAFEPRDWNLDTMTPKVPPKPAPTPE